MTRDYIVIIDFGTQFIQLIVRCVRELGIACVVVPFHERAEPAYAQGTLRAVILSGSPASSVQPGHPTVPDWVFAKGVPILGICYGQQIMAQTLGGTVANMGRHELGRAQLCLTQTHPLLEGLGPQEEVWMSHGDAITHLPEGFQVLAVSEGSPYAIIAHEERHFYGVQFHPEVTHTPCGRTILTNFLTKIAHCCPLSSASWELEATLGAIRHQVGSEHVLCAVSGGVDSSVLFALLHKAIGSQVVGIFVDTGLLRQGEVEEVMGLFKSHMGAQLRLVEGASVFLARLEGIEDPEQKRKIIGRTFIELFDQEVKKLSPQPTFLAQGTLYPDVIESSSLPGAPSVVIKSHHNVGGLPEQMNLKLLEPLRMMFKDEVRKLGLLLNLPSIFINRHPFPGPGLAVRILGAITQERIDLLRQADAIYLDELRKNDLYDKIWQAFAVLPSIRTVGVVGDGRAYDATCALRAVTSQDGMTADFYPFEMSFLAHVATRIINEVPGIGRVMYDITSKPPATIEWE